MDEQTQTEKPVNESTLLAALQLMLSQQQQAITPESIAAIVREAGLTTAEAMRKSLKPENPTHPGISAYSYPEGEVARPKPKFLNGRKVYINHIEEREDMLTPAEIEAYNAITENCSAKNGRWTAKIDKSGTTDRLFITVPSKTIDDRMGLPPLVTILRELAGGPEAVDVAKLAAELAEAKRRLDALTAVA